MRIIKHILSNDGHDFGKHLVLVPLDDTDNPRHAIVNADDFYYLMDNCCSKYWKLDHHNTIVVWGSKGQRLCAVKRLIVNAISGQGVKIRNGNPLDLRRHNLEIYEE
jgi:hypothetical protein